MSITKGSMLISNANAVGAELVNKLGGTGYKPVEWADAINLLGISNDDKASALAGITSGTYTGDERGAIHYSNCNEVGSMLNKKFSTDRGFKPVEWESAISKLTPLAEGTVSGDICTIVNGADDVPIKSCEVALPASLDGYSSVDVVQTGRNLVALNTSPQQAKRDFGITVNTQTADTLNITTTGVAYACERLFYSFKKGTYAVKFLATSSDSFTPVISIYRTNGTGVKFNIHPNTLTTFTLADDADIDIRLFASGSGDATVRTVEFSYLQIEVGSTVSTYSQYNSTQYTASLGRTIYGGTADVVNGEGKDGFSSISISETTWTYDIENSRFISGNLSGMKNTAIRTLHVIAYGYETIDDARPIGNVPDQAIYNANYERRVIIHDSNYTNVTDFLSAKGNISIIYPLATPTDFTFSPIEINSRLGYNAFWSEQGDTEVTYRKDPDIPDPPVQVINMNDNENNDN